MKQQLFNLPLMMLGSVPVLTGFFLFVFSLVVFSTTIISLTEDALAENALTNTNMTNNAIGKVVALRGKAQAIQSDLKVRPLALKSPVFLQDTIKTTQGRIQLMFKDNTLITLGRNTEMVIKKYQWKSGDPDSGIITQIKAGSFRIMGGAITRDAPQNFKTKAPAATIGIRGSMYAGIVRDTSLSVVFQGGKSIYVVNSMGRVDIDRPGYGTIVRDGSHPPAKPEIMDEKVLQEIEGELATTGETEKQDEKDPEGNSEDQLADSSMENADDFTDTATPPPENTSADIKDTIDDPNNPVNSPIKALPPLPPISEEEKNILALLKEVGFIGDRTTAIPSTGIWTYTGKLQDNNNTTIQDEMTVFVNWDNQRFLVLEDDPLHPDKTPHGFAFGQVTDSGEIVAVQVLGTENFNSTGQIETMSGHETFGHIYGASQEAAGMALEGVDISVQDQTIQRAWSDTMAVTMNTKTANFNIGSVTWNGFFMGVGENMDAPNIDRVAFVNDDSSDFQITLNKDSGIITGTLSGYDFLQPSNQISALTIGGDKNKSVYISDDKIAAVMGGVSVISNPSGNTGLKTHGNFMISSMETPLSANTNWGYWEVAYEEPGSGKDYHVHVPASFWIAGEQTPASMVNQIISDSVSTPFTGIYTGKAKGVKFDHTGQMTPLTNGQANLIIDFYSGATLPVTGDISFTEITLPISSFPGDVTSQGFKGTVSGADTGSKVNGTYFGNTAKDNVQGANGIGGNFSATFSGTTTYQGVFAGDR